MEHLESDFRLELGMIHLAAIVIRLTLDCDMRYYNMPSTTLHSVFDAYFDSPYINVPTSTYYVRTTRVRGMSVPFTDAR